MRKVYMLFIILLLLTSCGINNNAQSNKNEETPIIRDGVLEGISDKNKIEINDDNYIELINDIFLNSNNYDGKYIVIEGFYSKTNTKGIIINMISRHSSGCCTDEDIDIGFELMYDREFPKENDWIKVIGRLKRYKNSDDYILPYTIKIEVLYIEVKEDSGKEILK